MILEGKAEVGQSVWYRYSQKNEETHKMDREYGRGTIESITSEGKNIRANIVAENGNNYSLKPYDLYKDEFEMKMDRTADTFSDKMEDFAEKYVNQCSNLIRGISRSMMPPEAGMIVDDVKRRIQMLGAGLKDRFAEHTDKFLEDTREITMESIQKGFDGEEHMEMGAEKEPGQAAEAGEKVILTEADLKFAPQQETLKL